MRHASRIRSANRSALLGLVALVAAAGCEPRPPPGAAPTPSAIAAATGGTGSTAASGATEVAPPAPTASPSVSAPATSAPASPVPPRALEALAVGPGSATLALDLASTSVVDPAAGYRIVLSGRFGDARLSLLDAADAVVPATGAREVAETTCLTLQPAGSLTPAARYRLRVDGAVARALHAADGSPREPIEFQLVAAGEPPPARRKKGPARKPR